MRICPHCKKEFLGNGYQFGGHIRNCKMNPKLTEMNKNFYYNKKVIRNLYKIKCNFCNNIYEVLLTDYEFKAKKYKRYCSSNCSHHKIEHSCLYCGLPTKRQQDFCNKNCKLNFLYNSYIKKWKLGLVSGMGGRFGLSKHIRRYIFEKYDNKCYICGWNKIHPQTGKIPLTIHHKDGNYKNNIESNLELICPNCHSLTDNYGSLNIGNGRNKNAVVA